MPTLGLTDKTLSGTLLPSAKVILPGSVVLDAPKDPEPISFADVSIYVMTEAHATVKIPAEIRL